MLPIFLLEIWIFAKNEKNESHFLNKEVPGNNLELNSQITSHPDYRY